jgi:superoxide dismutase, Fe-Mn family
MKKLFLLLLVATMPLMAAVPSPYKVQDYSNLLGMPGFSDNALNTHFKLYEGYVKNSNLLLSILREYEQAGKEHTAQYGAIKRRLGWEMDGMRLHEMYFSNMGGNGQPNKESALYKEIVSQYGSYDAWKKDYQATGAIRGIGWSLLYRDPTDGRLMNMWINEHDTGHLVDGDAILPMDVWEHAYLLDYGINRQAYIDAFFENIDWKVSEDRYDAAVAKK